MNKTAILSFILDEVALKCRNVSSNMRKRIHWMLKYMGIILKKYDERALILNGLIRLGKYEIYIPETKEMRKGVSNFHLFDQKQLDRLLTLNNEVRCYDLDFIPTAPIEVESIKKVTIDQNNYNVYAKSSFNTAEKVMLANLSPDQIQSILKRFKRIDKLQISDSSLESIDFRYSRIK